MEKEKFGSKVIQLRAVIVENIRYYNRFHIFEKKTTVDIHVNVLQI